MKPIIQYITESALSDKVFCEQFSNMFKDTKITKDILSSILNNLDKEFIVKLSKYFVDNDIKNFVAYEPSEDLFIKYEDNKSFIIEQLTEYILTYKS